jgi:C_GCAxxG_C_C family probable redox protein
MVVDAQEVALSRHREGYSCSQSVLAVYAEELGLPIEVALRLAAPFGGGIGRLGEVCGAVSGGLMALGLRYGSATPSREAKERAYRAAREFVARFEARQGAFRCRDLLDCDISTAEGYAEARARDAFRTTCPAAIAAAAAIVSELLAEPIQPEA